MNKTHLNSAINTPRLASPSQGAPPQDTREGDKPILKVYSLPQNLINGHEMPANKPTNHRDPANDGVFAGEGKGYPASLTRCPSPRDLSTPPFPMCSACAAPSPYFGPPSISGCPSCFPLRFWGRERSPPVRTIPNLAPKGSRDPSRGQLDSSNGRGLGRTSTERKREERRCPECNGTRR